MAFNSSEFAVFLPIVLLGYFLISARRWRGRKAWLLVASYAFYMSWNPAFVVLLLITTLADFILARRIERATSPTGRRALLCLSVGANLGMLGFFKYGAFVFANTAWLLRPVLGEATAVFDVVLPIGISFYTFESLSYTIDVYRGRIAACRSLLDFSLFLAFFPHLVAGPIVRPAAFLPQLAAPPRMRGTAVEDALARITIGLIKKVLLADLLGEYVDHVFEIPGAYAGTNVLLAIYAYAFQIYYDFAGYTDIALGVAGLFGLTLPENFDRPYLAESPRDFWRRWHISLSTWLRDYLYVPLGGSRISSRRTYWNLMVTMVLGGLWHGAAWHFVAWGAYHGGLLAGERALRDRGTSWMPSTVTGRRLLTFHVVCLGWVLFRAPDVAGAVTVLRSLVGWGFVSSRLTTQTAILVAVAAGLHVGLPARDARAAWVRMPAWVQGAAYAGAFAAMLLLAPANARFIYFQF
jgi:D-alanyl-lipoteichoic acid acyltransferase DltB (MBOAT superfamily)